MKDQINIISNDEATERLLDYWQVKLANAPTLDLPTDRLRPTIQSLSGKTQAIRLSLELTEGLKALSQHEDVTLFMTLVAAFQVLLHRYSGQDDIVLGASQRSELDGLVSPVALRTAISNNLSFCELLTQVRETVFEAEAYQSMPFEKLLEMLNLQADSSRHPLFQVMFVLHAEVSALTTDRTPFDLTLELFETPNGLTGKLQYATDLFDASTIDRLIGHFNTLLDGIVANPETQLSELPMLTVAERQQQLVAWNNTAVSFPTDKCVHELFEAQVAQTPQAVAVIYEGSQLSYAELNAQANQLAHYLLELGVKPDSLVAICVERCLNMVVGVLAILKAGGAYVPLDTAYPVDRLLMMIEDSKPIALLTQGQFKNLFTELSNAVPMIDLDAAPLVWAKQPDSNLDCSQLGLSSAHLAYIIYTSGSTGNPKGVMISHANVTRLFASSDALYGFNNQDVWTFFHSYAFDFSVWELWGALLYGGKLVVVPYLTSRSPEEFYHLLINEGVTVLNQTPSAFRQLIQIDQTIENNNSLKLRYVIFGGEALDFSNLSPWFNKHGDQMPQLINMYGITETTVHVTYRALTKTDELSQKSDIGIALPDLQSYILDKNLQLQAIGIHGELHVAGAGLARGYLNRPELTAEKFIPNPFSDDPDSRLYKTGDLVRWLADGSIEYLGRIDQQIKLRGFRIELGEIESLLVQHPLVNQAIVIVREDSPGDKRLVAYLTHTQDELPNANALRLFLKEKLPEYMLPSAFVLLDTWPLTTNGKLDKKALPDPDYSQQVSEDNFVAPSNDVEKALAAIWSHLLRIEAVGIHDNFFELGGHSLLAIQVIVRIREHLSVEISLHALFNTPTIAELATLIENSSVSALSPSQPITPQPRGACQPDNTLTETFIFPASFSQQGLWLVDRLTGNTVNYNIFTAFRLHGKLDSAALETAINAIIHRHEALRTYFAEQQGEPVQVIQSVFSIPLTVIDSREQSEQQKAVELAQFIQRNQSIVFDLEKLPLLQLQLLRLGDEEYIFSLAFYHIIFDGWSVDVFIRELSALYSAFSQGQASPLPELTIQYADYSVWQRESLQGEALEQLLNYWKARLKDAPTLELLTDRPRPTVLSYRGQSQPFSLSPDLSEKLKVLSQREGVTLFMTLLATFQVLLHRYSGQDDIVIGTPSAGRNHLEIEDLIGFFVNTLALRIDVSGNPSFRELLVQVREVALGAYANQDISFEKLVEAINPKRDPSRNPLFQVMFILQNTPDSQLQLQGISAEPLQFDTDTTKFDLTLELFETAEGMTGRVEYATDLFDAETIVRLIGHFQTLLEAIVTQPEARLSELPMLTEVERQQLLVEWNNTVVPFPKDSCIHELFEVQAGQTPHAVAVIYEDSQLSYAELNAQANQLAHHLRELGVKPDTLVGVCVERCLNMVVAMLAVLKAGGAYVPLNPAYPIDLLTTTIEDSAPLVLLTQGRLKNLFASVANCLPMIDVDADASLWANQPDTNLVRDELGLTPTHLAYVIYTSGSTGKPKGVMIEHSGVCNMITDIKNRYHLCAEDRMLQFAALAFDVSVQEIFITLTAGAALVLRSDDWLVGASNFWALCIKNGVTVVKLPTAFWQQLIQEEQIAIPSTIRQMVIGGEAVSSAVLAAWFARKGYRPTLFNAYGPTETTVNSTIHALSADSLSWQSIGRPIANTYSYILDANKQPTPIGLAGELYIGGVGIARGYLKQDDMTAERFLPDPFAKAADARMYKTGDLVRWLADGTIEFLGRNDFQVKIRGFRIELGHIEAKLAEHPAVREIAVLAYEDHDGLNRLVAYLVLKNDFMPNISELRDFLKSLLPEFMIPSAFVFLDALPLTANGKLNRKVLPQPDQNQYELEANFVAPRNSVEAQLAEIWCNVLKIDRVGIHDNFFELGGHSLLAVKMIIEVNKQFTIDLPLGTIYQSSNIEKLATILSSGNQQPLWYSLVPIQSQGSRPPLFAIHTITLKEMPRHLGKEQPLYFLRYGMAAEISDTPVHLPPLEELASHYIKEMQQVQPQGPYHLIGFSFGGLIAYEMACQLLTKGQQVNLVGLLDTFLTNEKQLRPLHQMIYRFPSRVLELIKSKTADLLEPNKTSTDFWPHLYTPEPDQVCRNGYQLKTYNGQVTLFQGGEDDERFFIYTSPEHAWKKLLGDKLDVQQIHGSHFEIFNEPNVKILAAKIIACMDKAIVGKDTR